MTDRRTALITGGTGSLGFHTAETILAAGGWDVVIAGRNVDKVTETANRLGDGAVGCSLDLGSLEDVRRVADELPELDAVVCNAGFHTVNGTTFTQDGFEETFGVNHLGHFLLIREVLPKMAKPGRVVFVSSGTHDPAQRTGFPAPNYTTAQELAHPNGGITESSFKAGRRRYTTSKLCTVLAAYEFARRIPPDVATFNVFDPGQMPGTGIARDYPGIRSLAWRYVMPVMTVLPWVNMHTPESRAKALAGLILDPKLAATTGRYFTGRGEVRSSADSYDTEKATDLWETSVALTT